MNMPSDRNLLVYVAVVAVVVVVAALALALSASSNYSLNVAVSNNRTGSTFPYQTSIFTIKVSNEGSGAIEGLVVGFYVNGTELKHYTVTIPGHSNVTLNDSYIYTTSGSLYFQAVADPGKLLNVVNRNSTKSSVLVNVGTAEAPIGIASSIPNGNVTDTQSFILSGQGMYSASAIALAYNFNLVDAIFGPTKNMTAKIFDNLYGYIAETFGTQMNYANGTAAYVVWLQGTVIPGQIEYVTSTFRVPMRNATINGTHVSFAQTGNRTSMCTFYSNGWTKMLVYYNDSKNATCLSFVGKRYPMTESNSLAVSMNTSNVLTRYQTEFQYRNSTELGTSLRYSNSSFGAMNIFQNNYGLFASYVQKFGSAVNISANRTCYGIVYSNNGMHICSYIMAPISSSAAEGYGLVNTTEVTSDYGAAMYSLVNMSTLLDAQRNAASLIDALNISGGSARWTQSPKSTCLFNSTDIGCSINGFDYNNNTANLSMVNRLNYPISITSIGCHLPGVKYSMPVNETVGADSTASLIFPCYNMVNVPLTVESYEITANYTKGSVNGIAVGILNVTTDGFP